MKTRRPATGVAHCVVMHNLKQLNGKTMAAMRRELGLTQREFARQTGSSERTVRRVEAEQAPIATRGRHNVRLWQIIEQRYLRDLTTR